MAEVTTEQRLMVAAHLAIYAATHGRDLDDGERGEICELTSAGPLDVDAYDRRWSTAGDDGGLFARRLRYAVEWFGEGSRVVQAAYPSGPAMLATEAYRGRCVGRVPT